MPSGCWQVFYDDGTPASKICVGFLGKHVVASTLTELDGAFSFNGAHGLPAGRYAVALDPTVSDGVLRDEWYSKVDEIELIVDVKPGVNHFRFVSASSRPIDPGNRGP